MHKYTYHILLNFHSDFPMFALTSEMFNIFGSETLLSAHSFCVEGKSSLLWVEMRLCLSLNYDLCARMILAFVTGCPRKVACWM